MDWAELSGIAGDGGFVVERARRLKDGIVVEGVFEPPPLARLGAEDQAFVAAFVHCHGSIKQMERWFGVSYPTIKNRLNRIAGQLEFAEVELEIVEDAPARRPVLDRLETGEISVAEALAEIEGGMR